MNSDGLISSNGSGLFLGPLLTNNTTSSSVLLFDPLTLVHEGSYTCKATFRAMTISYTYSITVATSKSVFM